MLLLDEAHTVGEEIGSALLNASQQVGRELPFLLVLAGTPELRYAPRRIEHHVLESRRAVSGRAA